jgi:hypothetical protein
VHYAPPVRTPQACAVRDDDSKKISRSRMGDRNSTVEYQRNIRVQLPFWLCRTAWDIAMQRAVGCWTLSLRPIVWIPSSHEVWRNIELGDADEVMEMLERRKVPLHAHNDENDMSLVGVCGRFFCVISIYITDPRRRSRTGTVILRINWYKVVQSSRYAISLLEI